MPPSPSPISPTSLRSDLYHSLGHGGDDASPPLVIPVLASLLERSISRDERLQLQGNDAPPDGAAAASRFLAFDGHRIPDMSLQSFLERVFRYTGAAPSVYVVAYAYVDRARRLRPGLRVTRANAHRLLLAAIVVASKFLEDLNYSNSHFAKVGGVPTSELNRMEVELLFLMGFKLHVSVSVFESYCRHLEREVGRGGGYQVERALRLVCGGEITGKERGRTELNQAARVL